ncbi:MAG: PAS domain-containing protein [Devosia sp.]|uniref:PAS domain-containing protein n=1 Tax=Devosia sp. TaxID=1871048 RepID=UPI001A646B2B|nr:PAS domain-containing protein [Devosia sp.]MBL8596114.1 PAS domain-containing protein [Devosia sp.]
MFTQQLTSEFFPALDEGAAAPSLNDADIVRRLLERHTGFAQFRIMLPMTVTWSAEAARMRGEEPGTSDISLGEAVRAYIPADRKRLVETITRAIERKQGFRFIGRRRVGNQTRVLETIADLRIEDGAVTEVVGLTRDVSMKLEREALGISRARLIRRMVEDMPVPVVVLDRALRIVACSAAWARSHGLAARDDALGKPVNKLIQVSSEMTSAIIDAPSGQTAKVTLPFYAAEDGRQVARCCVVVPWQCGSDAAGGVLMLVGEEHPPYATLEVADRALGRRTRGIAEMLEALA